MMVSWHLMPQDAVTDAYASENLRVVPLTQHTYLHISYLQTESWGKVACNGLVVVRGGEAVVIDTPVDAEATEELLSWITTVLKAQIRWAVATHFHEDCLGGLGAFHERGIPSYGHWRTPRLAQKAGHTSPNHVVAPSRSVFVGGDPLQLIYLGKGHTKDNIVAYVPQDKVLFGGCLVKAMGAGKGNLEDADVAAWPETIRKVLEAFPEAEVVVPGHGEPGGPELLEYTWELFGGR